MNNSLRQLLRESLNEIYLFQQSSIIIEAYAKQHFIDRVHNRVLSNYSSISKDEELEKLIINNLELLKKINFPGQDNIAVEIFSSLKQHYYKKPVGYDYEQSKGNKIWVIIRGNDLETIIFSNSKPQNTQIYLSIDRLKNYINNVKNGDFNLTEEDLIKLQSPNLLNPTFKPKKKLENIHIVNINGVKHIIDTEKEMIYQKNKPDQKYNIFDYIENLKDKELADKLLALFI